ncbi:hypothetical protein NQZ68_017394 [Dissostichus eleginoides]|nr:hypothetical protein NQZ68_017394 [Dissostichus eleginoides]
METAARSGFEMRSRVKSTRMTNKKPSCVSITKVKQFQGSSAFAKRSQWTIDQLRQVNGIDSNKDCPEFDLMFENAFDQWVACSAGEKCTFIQILHHTCQRYSSAQKPDFVNCQSKLLGVSHQCKTKITTLLRCGTITVGDSYLQNPLGWQPPESQKQGVPWIPFMLLKNVSTLCFTVITFSTGGAHAAAHHSSLEKRGNEKDQTRERKNFSYRVESNSILHSAADSVTSAVQKASQALNERGERLGRAEERTADMMNSAEQFSVTAQKLAMKHKC